MEELLKQAFQLGQQWVQDMNNDKEPTTFNEWYISDKVQIQVKNNSIHTARKSVCETFKCDNCGMVRSNDSCNICGNI